MNIVNSVYNKLDLFENPHEILTLLVSESVQEADSNLQADIQKLLSYLDEASSDQKFKWAKQLLSSVAYYKESPPVFRVYGGENFSIRIDLEEGRDFSGFALTIRRADNGALLSPADTLGDSHSNAPVQYAYIDNLNLISEEFFKVHVLLEETGSNDLATGNAVTLLTQAWLIVEGSIDA
jgi:hypothetical protein